MCFFKGLSAVKNTQMAMGSPVKTMPEDTASEMLIENDFFSIPDSKPKSLERLDINMMLLNCLGLANINSQMMCTMEQVTFL